MRARFNNVDPYGYDTLDHDDKTQTWDFSKGDEVEVLRTGLSWMKDNKPYSYFGDIVEFVHQGDGKDDTSYIGYTAKDCLEFLDDEEIEESFIPEARPASKLEEVIAELTGTVDKDRRIAALEEQQEKLVKDIKKMKKDLKSLPDVNRVRSITANTISDDKQKIERQKERERQDRKDWWCDHLDLFVLIIGTLAIFIGAGIYKYYEAVEEPTPTVSVEEVPISSEEKE